jgi:hypothetical protein
MNKVNLWATIIFILVIFTMVLAKTADNDDRNGMGSDGDFRYGEYLGRHAAQTGEPTRVSFRRWATIANQESFIRGYQAGYKKILEANVQQRTLILNTQASFRDGVYLGKLDAKLERTAHIAAGRWPGKEDRASFGLGYRQSYEKLIANRNKIKEHRNLAFELKSMRNALRSFISVRLDLIRDTYRTLLAASLSHYPHFRK